MSPEWRVSFWPICASIVSTGKPPGRRRQGRSFCRPMMVLSKPTVQWPPVRIASILCPSPWATCSAVVALMRPEGLADGAAMGVPAASMSCLARRASGTRRAMVGSPAVTSGAMGAPGLSGVTRVRGPGQNACASDPRTGGISAIFAAAAALARCTISGLKLGRPLASKIRATARSLFASAPSPNTVSVGKATRPPSWMIRPACSIPALSGAII